MLERAKGTRELKRMPRPSLSSLGEPAISDCLREAELRPAIRRPASLSLPASPRTARSSPRLATGDSSGGWQNVL